MGAPARLTTASTSLSTIGSIRRCWGSQRCSSAVRGVRRTSCSTSCPSARRAGTSAPPMRPDAPATAIFTNYLLRSPRTRSGPRLAAGALVEVCSGESELAVELAGLQPLLHRGEEPGGVGAVDDAVVVGQRQVGHRADGDDLSEL